LLYTISCLDADVAKQNPDDLELVARLGTGETEKMDLKSHDNKA